MAQDLITFSCKECKRQTYYSSKNKKQVTEKLELRKYCKWCRHHTEHREGK